MHLQCNRESQRLHTLPGEQGQSLVEFAVSLVIILILLAGIVDAGRALFTYMALRDAAQEGALYGSIDPQSVTETCPGSNPIVTRVCHASDMVQGFGGNIQVQVTVSGAACTGGAITVRVTYASFPLTMPFIGIFVGAQSVPISATITDTILAPACT